MKEWMPWHATKQQTRESKQRRECLGIRAKIGTMMQHEGEHAKACEQFSKVRIEYAEAY